MTTNSSSSSRRRWMFVCHAAILFQAASGAISLEEPATPSAAPLERDPSASFYPIQFMHLYRRLQELLAPIIEHETDETFYVDDQFQMIPVPRTITPQEKQAAGLGLRMPSTEHTLQSGAASSSTTSGAYYPANATVAEASIVCSSANVVLSGVVPGLVHSIALPNDPRFLAYHLNVTTPSGVAVLNVQFYDNACQVAVGADGGEVDCALCDDDDAAAGSTGVGIRIGGAAAACVDVSEFLLLQESSSVLPTAANSTTTSTSTSGSWMVARSSTAGLLILCAAALVL